MNLTLCRETVNVSIHNKQLDLTHRHVTSPLTDICRTPLILFLPQAILIHQRSLGKSETTVHKPNIFIRLCLNTWLYRFARKTRKATDESRLPTSFFVNYYCTAYCAVRRFEPLHLRTFGILKRVMSHPEKIHWKFLVEPIATQKVTLQITTPELPNTTCPLLFSHGHYQYWGLQGIKLFLRLTTCIVPANPRCQAGTLPWFFLSSCHAAPLRAFTLRRRFMSASMLEMVILCMMTSQMRRSRDCHLLRATLVE